MNIVVIGPNSQEKQVDGYRELVHELGSRGHNVLLLERGVPSKPEPRRSAHLTSRRQTLYRSVSELKRRFTHRVRHADVVIVASPQPEGVDVGQWVTGVAKGVKAFFDSDTPGTLSELERGLPGDVTEDLIPKYDLYLASAGGQPLEKLQQEYKSPMARTLHGDDRAATLERYVAEVLSGHFMS
jgi:hypothetical protein